MKLSPRYSEALVFAAEIHADQVRKVSGVPYISHPLGVSSLVLQFGGDEDQAIAALLHDGVEDQGGFPMLNLIRARFGDRVAAMVWAATDSVEIPKPAWRPRKEGWLIHLVTAYEPALLVIAADKVHNAQAILDDHETVGDEVWARFRGGHEGTVWYYGAVHAVLARRIPDSLLVAKLGRLVRMLEETLPSPIFA